MFERFTDRARRTVVLAQENARLLGHNYIGTEHILLGLVQEGEGVAAQALANLGIEAPGVRTRVKDVGTVGTPPIGHIPFTPRAKAAFEQAMRDALQLGHSYIGTEHLLLGLTRLDDCVAVLILQAMGVRPALVRREVVTILSSYNPSQPAEPAAGTQVTIDFDELVDVVTRAVTEAIKGMVQP